MIEMARASSSLTAPPLPPDNNAQDATPANDLPCPVDYSNIVGMELVVDMNNEDPTIYQIDQFSVTNHEVTSDLSTVNVLTSECPSSHEEASTSQSRRRSVGSPEQSRDSSEEFLNNLVQNQPLGDEMSLRNEEYEMDNSDSPLSVLSNEVPDENLASVGVVQNVKKKRARKGKAQKSNWFYEKQKKM